MGMFRILEMKFFWGILGLKPAYRGQGVRLGFVVLARKGMMILQIELLDLRLRLVRLVLGSLGRCLLQVLSLVQW